MDLIRTHDGPFKFVFGEPEQMAELLRACLPKAVADAIDWSTLRRVPGSFVDKALKGRHTDLLFTARMGKATVLLYVVPEHKSADDRFTAWQMACYVVRILEQWLGEQVDADELPAVLANLGLAWANRRGLPAFFLPLVMHHGRRPVSRFLWRPLPRKTQQPTGLFEALSELDPTLRMLAWDLTTCSETQLMAEADDGAGTAALAVLAVPASLPRGSLLRIPGALGRSAA
ncbi:MAG: Rpn family recombination-promoting nuclease/putative transposase [Planctomycetota bacterium]